MQFCHFFVHSHYQRKPSITRLVQDLGLQWHHATLHLSQRNVLQSYLVRISHVWNLKNLKVYQSEFNAGLLCFLYINLIYLTITHYNLRRKNVDYWRHCGCFVLCVQFADIWTDSSLSLFIMQFYILWPFGLVQYVLVYVVCYPISPQIWNFLCLLDWRFYNFICCLYGFKIWTLTIRKEVECVRTGCGEYLDLRERM